MVSFWALVLVISTSSSTLSLPWLTMSTTGITTVSSFPIVLKIPNHQRRRRRRRRRHPPQQQNRWPRLAPEIFMIGTGFSFDDGEQILVSIKKPLGLILEQQCDDDDDDHADGDRDDQSTGTIGEVYVADVDTAGSAGRAGVESGDVLVAVQNTSTESWDLDDVLQLIRQSPAVVNLRFKRRITSSEVDREWTKMVRDDDNDVNGK